MPRRHVRGLALGLSACLSAGLLIGGAQFAAADPNPPDGGSPTPKRSANASSVADELPNPAAEKQRALRQEALQLVLTGQRKVQKINGVEVVKVGEKPARLTRAEQARVRAGQRVPRRMVDQYVRLSREQTDRVFVILTEFSNTREPRYPDQDTAPTIPGPATFDGPLHNAIPAPNRAADNSTIWQPDYSADHYRRLYFGTGPGVESLKTYYERQSSGRYSIAGLVTDWVKVQYNEARYGRSDDNPTDANGDDPAVCASNVCSNNWALLTDGLTQWVADLKAAGRTDAQIKELVTSYDRQDRYDFDGDGNFREPDGYIDHFQIVHSGGDQADGDPYQGEDAIWSHRWKAYQNLIGTAGPTGNLDGGVQIGTTGIWAADYTIQPENGGLSVFAHEYGHDLGLPDLYDTSGGGDNAVNWWSLMAQSRVKARNDVGIGTRAADLGMWEKMQLGWFDYEIAVAELQQTYNLGPHEYNSRRAQGLVVVLPDKQVTTTLPTPPEGTRQWWSGSGDDRTSTLTRQVTLPAGSAELTFQANWNIEDCDADPCDYAYVEVQDGAGAAWTPIAGNITTASEGNGVDGDSDGYQPATFDLSAYAGSTIGLRFRYTTDGAVQGQNPDEPAGLFVDQILLTAGGTTVFEDGAEDGNNGWTPVGFSIVEASVTNAYDHFYLASYRAYVSYDRYLRTGPYNFGWLNTQPDRVEFFPYQDGLLINYWDTSQTDNNESEHPGEGLILPIDSHPSPIYNLSSGAPWRGRIQTYDSTFSRQPADSFTLHLNGQPSYVRGQPAQPLFDDSREYWNATLPFIGVKVPNAGVTMRVLEQGATSMRVRLGYQAPPSPVTTAQR